MALVSNRFGLIAATEISDVWNRDESNETEITMAGSRGKRAELMWQ